MNINFAPEGSFFYQLLEYIIRAFPNGFGKVYNEDIGILYYFIMERKQIPVNIWIKTKDSSEDFYRATFVSSQVYVEDGEIKILFLLEKGEPVDITFSLDGDVVEAFWDEFSLADFRFSVSSFS